ncbi:MAG TPA: TonB-dependent receptor plug domain-containing protein [Gemmatimonadales bacterium]|jgi:TonB-dependent SusC/RagA subfamily outer membrane receptor
MGSVSRHPILAVAFLLAACGHRKTVAAAEQPQPKLADVVLTAADIERAPGMSLEQLLLTRVPGITLTRAADGHTFLRLRGQSTILGDQEPLIVVNDVPLDPNASGNLSVIDPHDIETVQVIRDAAATSLYGLRGSNGVIIIRTKQS